MTKYLVGFSYHDPITYKEWKDGLIEDFESSTAIFIDSKSQSEALQWGQEIAQIFFEKFNPLEKKSWSSFGHICWVEENLRQSAWIHCLEFFQTVRTENYPNFSKMGSDAYVDWTKQININNFLEFGDPKNNEIERPTNLLQSARQIMLNLISLLIPKANPDFENIIEQVEIWKIEYDPKSQITLREIGLNLEGTPILAMPYKNNLGYWVDNDLSLTDYENFKPKKISAENFLSDWNRLKLSRNGLH